MKKIILFSIFAIIYCSSFAQFNNKQDVINSINLNVKSNPTTPLTGATLNTILKGVIAYAADTTQFKTVYKAQLDSATAAIVIQNKYLPIIAPVAHNDIEVADLSKGVILRSPNGTRWRLTLNNDGSVTTTSL